MALSWNEIRDRAVAFSKEWSRDESEEAEAKSFLDAFFEVFGISRRRVASFEKKVKKIDGKDGYVDLLWRGVLLVEFKSKGKDLDRAYTQATGYFPGIKERDLPRYILVCDFARFRLYDLETNEQTQFPLKDFYKHIRLFGFVAGYQAHAIKPEDPANIKAAELMGKLHDQLKAVGYDGHPLELYLVRLLFCVFADDTSIFERNQFQEYIEAKTAEDGHDIGHHLSGLFHTLNTAPERRLKTLDEHLAAFPYVNGRLFEETLPPAAFDAKMRNALLQCSVLDWSRISPAIFGSLFQSVMVEDARRSLGAHYTTEQNILKVIHPLFLDSLWEEFAKVKGNKPKLVEFHKRLAALKFLDPACGCGNFLVITYRELRLLELRILRELHAGKTAFLDVSQIVWVDVDQFYGIEIEEFPAQIAQVALWMVDHQMNMQISEEFGHYFRRLPLTKAPNIVRGNALTTDWKTVIPPDRLHYILGNPPFGGAKFMNDPQRQEMAAIFHDTRNSGLLDYVSAWYRLAADYMSGNPAIRTAFVSTNSITQGEQVGVLWPDLLRRGVRINFAHRTFQWTSEASGRAAVHCVIIGFALEDEPKKNLFYYDNIRSDPHRLAVSRINPYLVDGPDVTLVNRENPLCHVPSIGIGNKPIDGGHYLFTPDEKAAFVAKEPLAVPYFRRWMGAEEFLNGIERWCLWLGDCPPADLRRMPQAMARVDAVRAHRLASKSAPTRKLAATPTRFHVENIPTEPFLVIPEVSSERRPYLPIGFLQPDTLASNKLRVFRAATPYHFGILSSIMHMAWMRYVTGRLKSDYQYSVSIVYNNFPWPTPTVKQQDAVSKSAEGVLAARLKFPGSSLADLYDPLSMPPELSSAHQVLDRAVDAAYGKTSFPSEMERVAFLFERYAALSAPLVPATEKKKRRASKASAGSAAPG